MAHSRNELDPVEAKLLRRKKRKRSIKIGITFSAIQLLLSIAVTGLLIYLDVLPMMYLSALVAVLFLFNTYTFFTQFSKKFRTFGKVLAIFMIVVLGAGTYYLSVTANVLSSLFGNSYREEIVSVYVMKDEDVTTLEECRGYTFGFVTTDQEVTNKAFAEIEKTLGNSYDVAAYTSYNGMLDEFYDSVCEAVLVKESDLSRIKAVYDTFEEDTIKIASYTIKVKTTTDASPVKVTKEPFIVYVSGIDVYGDVSQSSRSDVNIIAVVNPNTHKVLLVSAPRDSYVELPFAEGEYDKLTHVGNHGVEASMEVLSNLYGVDIHYYLRMNFSGFMEIVDALGGITIENEETFTSHDGYYFEEGTLELDGLHALHYARERKAFALGDVQRGINQMKVIKAMAQKALSPALLVNFTEIMTSVADAMDTNMSMNDVSSLVKAQLKKNEGWDISSAYLKGYSDSRYTYSYSEPLSVYVLDEESVEEVKAQIQAMMNEK